MPGPDYDAWARETPDTPAGRGAWALAAALNDLTADAIEGCALEQVILIGTYTDGRSGYRGNLQRAIEPDELRALLLERHELAEARANRQHEIERLQAWLCICPQVAPEHFDPDPACIVHGDPRAPHASTRALTDAFEQLVMRIHRDFNFDAGECAPPEGETALRMMDDLVRYTEELSLKLETGEAL